MRKLNLVGQSFGFVTVIGEAEPCNGKSCWLYRCACGSVRVTTGVALRLGHVRSCGCKRAQMARQRSLRHGKSFHPAYAVWSSMIQRCHNPKHRAFKNYGARGIFVCDSWRQAFENFWTDMKDGYSQGLTLDRKDNSLGYSKSNCQWATHRAQNRNRRSNRTILTPAGEMLLQEASELSGIGKTTLSYRLRRGWPVERLFDQPSPIARQ